MTDDHDPAAPGRPEPDSLTGPEPGRGGGDPHTEDVVVLVPPYGAGSGSAPGSSSTGSGFTVGPFSQPPDGVGLGHPMPPPDQQAGAHSRSATRRWSIALAILLAAVLIAGGALFFLLRENDAAAPVSGGSSASQPASDSQRPAPTTASEPPGPAVDITGSYEVTGTITSVEGPQAGALGGGKEAGDATFGSPQNWTIEGCTDGSGCTLQIDPGSTTIPLSAAGKSWRGQTTVPYICDVTGQTTTQATLAVEIHPDRTATRTLSATCSAPMTEQSILTLTRK